MNSNPIYKRLLGAQFERMPPALQQFHALQGHHVLHGEVEVASPSTSLARLLARMLGSPQQAQRGPIRFELQADGAAETWTRHFPGCSMRSTFRQVAGCLEERLGAARLHFRLVFSSDKLELRLVRMYFLGVRCPSWLLPSLVAEETSQGGRLLFNISASVPVAGIVARYRGFLDLSQKGLQ